MGRLRRQGGQAGGAGDVAAGELPQGLGPSSATKVGQVGNHPSCPEERGGRWLGARSGMPPPQGLLHTQAAVRAGPACPPPCRAPPAQRSPSSTLSPRST